MIRVVKPAAAPTKLLEGATLTVDHCTLFDADPAPYVSGASVFEIDSAIYGHPSVKDALRTAQHSKCCFCEGLFEANAAADVEHFRPKKYSQQARRGRKLYPGYFWLGYAWSNLYYCCQVCNRSNKKNYFPLRNPTSRVHSHLGNLNDEEPLLLDPGGPKDPRDHIQFHAEVAVGATDAGEATVDYIGLNRPALIDARLELYQQLVLMRKIAQRFTGALTPEQQQVVDDARQFLSEAVRPQTRFSAMARDLLTPPAPPA